jgi:hypothetical protein
LIRRVSSLALGLLTAGLIVLPGPAAHAATDYYLSPTGTNGTLSCSGGGSNAPWRTFTYALPCLRAGDRLLVRGGTYYEEENLSDLSHHPGTATAPMTVQAYPGERPVIKGFLNIRNAHYWVFDGINVTWDGISQKSAPLVKFMNGVGWTFKNAEVWGAHSYAGIIVGSSIAGEPKNWTISGNCVHHTYPSNGANQDHNIYIQGIDFGPGTIERNIIYYAPNGENIKLGGTSATARGTGFITVRYNTMYYAGQNLLVAWKSHDNVIRDNIMSKAMGKSWYPNIRGYAVSGKGNVARNNFGFAAARLIFNTDQNSTPISNGVADQGGDHFGIDPQFNSVSSCSGFVPQNPAVRNQGRYAPPGTPVSGDWNHDGTDTIGFVSDGRWSLRNSNSPGSPDISFAYGRPTDIPIAGDWNGDGTDTIGVFRAGVWYLRNSNSAGATDTTFAFGKSTDIPIVGDWNGDGKDTIGVVRGNTWYLRNANSAGGATAIFSFGRSTDVPIPGDWNGDGKDTLGVVRGNVWYLRNANSAGSPDVTLSFARASDSPIRGVWNADGIDWVGSVRVDQWFLKDPPTSGGGVVQFSFPS